MQNLRFTHLAMIVMILFAFSCGEDEPMDDKKDEETNTEAPAGTDLVIALAGTYTVTEVTSGTHDRMSITIGSDGAIDFDSSVSFEVTDIMAVYDRITCCQRVQVSYGADDDGEVINLFTDTSGANLESVQFRHNNENIDIHVTVE